MFEPSLNPPSRTNSVEWNETRFDERFEFDRKTKPLTFLCLETQSIMKILNFFQIKFEMFVKKNALI